MLRADVISLITETASAHGVHATVTETVREVMCTVRSVSRSEYYTALNAGIEPSLVFHLSLSDDYQDERIVRYRGKKYRVVRTYLTDGGGIEITVERSDVNGESEEVGTNSNND